MEGIVTVYHDGLRMHDDPRTPLLGVPLLIGNLHLLLVALDIRAQHDRRVHHLDGAHTVATGFTPRHAARPAIIIIGCGREVQRMNGQTSSTSHNLRIGNLALADTELLELFIQANPRADFAQSLHQLHALLKHQLMASDVQLIASNLIGQTDLVLHQQVDVQPSHDVLHDAQLLIIVIIGAPARVTDIVMAVQTFGIHIDAQLVAEVHLERMEIIQQIAHLLAHLRLVPLIPNGALNNQLMLGEQLGQMAGLHLRPDAQYVFALREGVIALIIPNILLAVGIELRPIKRLGIQHEHQFPFFSR